MPVLGYDIDPRGGRLIVNDAEAKQVREIFKLYAKHRSVPKTLAELEHRQWTMKSWTTQYGSLRTGSVFDKAALLRLLTNPLYIGKIEHKGTIYPGEQRAIVEPAVWEEINTELVAARRNQRNVIRTAQHPLLEGLLFCKNCDRPMVPTYTSKGDRRYSYYVCRTVREKGWKACPTKSIAARAIEESVVAQLRSALQIEAARDELRLSEADWLAFDERNPDSLLKAVVRRVGYDGTNGTVSLDLSHK